MRNAPSVTPALPCIHAVGEFSGENNDGIRCNVSDSCRRGILVGGRKESVVVVMVVCVCADFKNC